MTKEEVIEQIEKFIKYNRKICWEAEYQEGEFCIGENKVKEFVNSLIEKLSLKNK